MKKLILNLKVTKKLTLLSLVGISGLIISTIVAIYMMSTINAQQKKLDSYTALKNNIEVIRTNYNAIRGDVLLFFLLDPVLQKEQTNKTEIHYAQILQSLNEKEKSLTENEEDKELSEPIKLFLGSIERFIKFSEKNKKDIINISSNEDSLYASVKNKLLFEYDPLFLSLLQDRNTLIKVLEQRSEIAVLEMESATRNGFIMILCIAMFTSIAVFLISNYIGKQISRPVIKVKTILEKISAGELPHVEPTDVQDEIGDMINSMQTLVSNLDSLKTFTKEVGNGNFDNDITIFQNKGDIAVSLFSMKTNLKKAAEIERQQGWISQGLAETGKLLRLNYETSADLYNAIISFAVKYINANQGSFFITNTEGNETKIDLAASWAFNRRKYIEKSILPGEGMVGQVYLEREGIYMTELPDNYIRITSGLGDAPPKNLIVLPLINNSNVQGILEIASFKIIEEYQKDFLKQFADVVAAEIASEKITSKTQELLHISQQQTEELRAQEEEVRQNMEELTSTQEEMNRRSIEMQEIIDELRRENETLKKVQLT